MQSHCPHCDSLVDVPDRQTDVLCPNCHRFFLWTPELAPPFKSLKNEENPESNNAGEHFDQEKFQKHLEQQREEELSAPSEPASESESHGTRAQSVGLYKDYALGGNTDPEPQKHKTQRKKTGKNMYPYELPGQVVEADRRMPVFSSMMYDALIILCANVGTMITAMFFFTMLLGALFLAAAAAYFGLAQLTESVNIRMTIFLAIFFISSIGFVWIINGQKLYVISLIRQGKTSTSLLFSGTIGLFRNLVVVWIHLIPLTIPAIVAYWYYIWSSCNNDLEQLENDLGGFFYVFQQTPAAVAISAAIIGLGAFLIIILNWGLAFWLIIDKDLGVSEALDVSHKITYEKKATFLGVLTSSAGVVIVLSSLSMGITLTLVPIALLFIGMYYMKTAIQEMVIPGKTALGAHASLYGNNGELSDESDEEEDIL